MSDSRSQNRFDPVAILRRSALGAVVLCLVLPAGAAHASSWRFDVTPYLWATDVGIDAKVDGRQVIDKTIPVSDLVEDIDTIFQLRFEATHAEFGVLLDVFDVTMSDEKHGVGLPGGAGTADLDADVGLTIVDAAALFDPKGDQQGLAFVGGTRILNDRATVDATFRTAMGPIVPQTYDTSETLVDALVGLRFTRRFARHWSVQMQADVSTGDTDHTWSAGPAISYSFGDQGRVALSAGYRRMEVDFKDEDGLDNTMTLSGSILGLRFSF